MSQSNRVPAAQTSPLAGLDRAQLSFAQVLGQSVAAVAPSAVMVTVPALVIADVGDLAIAVFLVATLLMTAVGYCVGQFSTRMVAVSGLYSYVVKGLGPVGGVVAGLSVVIGYAGAAMASVLGASSYIAALLGRIGVPDGTTTVCILAVLVGALTVGLMVRGVRLSARITLVVEFFAIAFAAVVLIVAFVHAGGEGRSPPDPETSGSTLAFTLLLSIVAFVGFESAGTLAREARNPFVAVSRAVRWTPLALGALYVFASAMQTPALLGDANDQLPFVLDLPNSSGAVSTTLSVLLEVGITASWLACVIGSTTALSRTLFAMGREGVMPRVLGRAHATYRTPHVALLTVMPVMVAVTITYLLVASTPRSALLGLLTASAHGYVFAYVLLCVATPVFLYRIGELTRVPLIIGSLTAAVLVTLITWAAFAQTFVAGKTTAVFIALLALGLLVYMWRVRRDPQVRERVGLYDEPVGRDIVDNYRPWEVRR